MKINLLLITAVAALIGTPTLAQTNATNEQQFSGRLEDKSPQDDGHPYQIRTMALEAGKRYGFSADSEDFDPALRVSLADDNDEVIAEDDDGGDGTNAYLEFSPKQSGTYRVRVYSVSGAKGSYLLKARALSPLPALIRPDSVASATMIFQDYVGELTDSDGEIAGRRVDDYAFRFEGGKKVLIAMDRESDDLDPVLEIYPANDRFASEAIASDDDSGDETNAFLMFTPQESSEFIVRATSYTGNPGAGSYRLRIGQQP